MGDWSSKDICERSREAEEVAKPMRPYIEQAMRFSMPWRHPNARNGRIFEGIFDSSGMTGAHKFPGRVQQDVTPPTSRFFSIEGGPLIDARQRPEVNKKLGFATEMGHTLLSSTGFHKASKEAYADLGIGTGALLSVKAGENQLIRWNAVPPWQLGIEEGPSGKVDNVYWPRGYRADHLERLWPGATWPKAVRALIAKGARDKVRILQASYFDPDILRWRYRIVCLETSERGEIVWESLHRTNPWNVFRWWTTPDSPWGIGPLMMVLPDIMTANKAVEMILKAAAYALAPPLMVAHDGVVNPDTLRIAPHALIRVARTGGPLGSSIQPLQMNGQVDLAQLALQDVRQSIAQHTLSRQLPPENASVRSPTEIVERLRDFAFDTGSAFGSFNDEYVPGLVARTLDLADQLKIPGMDFDELMIDQLILKVTITGPIARSQALTDVESITRYLEILNAILGREGMMAIANVEELHRLAAMMGTPDWINRDAADRDKMLAAMGQAAAELRQESPVPGGGGAPQLSLAA